MATNAIVSIEISCGDNVAPATIAERLAPQADDPHRACNALAAHLAALAGGVRTGKVRVRVSSSTDVSVRATATITCVFANTDLDDTVSIGGVTLTAKASPANENEFAIGTTNPTMAAGLLAAIQAHSKLKYLTATLASNVVTLTFDMDPMTARDAVVLATSDADGLVITQPALSGSPTVANVQATRTYARGQP